MNRLAMNQERTLRRWLAVSLMVVFGVALATVSMIWGIGRALPKVSDFQGPEMKCVAGLTMLADAKQAYVRSNGSSNGTVLSMADLQPYLNLPVSNCMHCYESGTVEINPVGELPSCSIAAHQDIFRRFYTKLRAGREKRDKAQR